MYSLSFYLSEQLFIMLFAVTRIQHNAAAKRADDIADTKRVFPAAKAHTSQNQKARSEKNNCLIFFCHYFYYRAL